MSDTGIAGNDGKTDKQANYTCLLYTSDAADELDVVYISVVAVSLKKFFFF